VKKPYFTAFSFRGFTNGHPYLGNKAYPVLFYKDYALNPCYFSAYNALKTGGTICPQSSSGKAATPLTVNRLTK
jgi:hypothetical protein